MRAREAVLRTAKKRGIFRPLDVAIPRAVLSRLVEEGTLEKAGRGLYRLASVEPSEHHTLVEVAARIPQGIISLLSALEFHGVGTQNPSKVWVTIDVRARRPQLDYPPIQVMRASDAALRAGVEKHVIEGRKIHIYSLEKTIADCFKYRNKIGVEVAIEALKDAYKSRRLNMDTLWKFARVCRVSNVMRPYLEVL